jgi:cell filamentation protein
MTVDPYVYPGTETLKNHMGIRDPDTLATVEADVTHLALTEITETGVPGDYNLSHLQEFHRRIFSDIYPWAGEIRTIDIAKTDLFGNHLHLRSYLDEQFAKLAKDSYLRGLNQDDFLDGLTEYLGEVNAAHPFREGNGRTQRAFFGQLARDAGYRIAWEHLDRDRNIEASIASHHGNNVPLRALLTELINNPQHQQEHDLTTAFENSWDRQQHHHRTQLSNPSPLEPGSAHLRHVLNEIAAERDAAEATIHHKSHELERTYGHEHNL